MTLAPHPIFANYPQYDSYRESGVEWIGKIPSSWNVRRGKWLFERMERPVRPEDEIVTCFRDGVVTLRSNRRTDGFTNAMKEHGYQGIRKGDLVIHAMDAFAGAIGVSDSDGKSTPVYSACVPRVAETVEPTFYAYYMRNIAMSGLLIAIAKGIRERSTDFRFNDFADLALAVPPLHEQRAIAAFMDGKRAKIDEAVWIKEEQIALLRERRQILIQQAVTRGLNPDAPMKDSGIDWIGQIPAHWNIQSVRYAFKFRNNQRVPLSGSEREHMQGEYPYYGASGIIDYVDDYIYNEDLILIAEDGANLLSKSTPLAFVARGKYWVNNHAHILEPQLSGFEYWAELLSAADYTVYISGSAQPKLTRDRLGSVRVPVPPKEEIQEIIAFIKQQTQKFENAISIKRSQIGALKEYKTSLINAAVTGKIKVI